ncbi:ABC transporter permease [Malacoplasma penetrans]|uniref:Uncharacterized protein n=1 Tax=Malacoplasma penetrans (strain HF-2) TaxID=272633 RepID=Q8EVG8_MALP2|nr:ABC transporter permease [Malacoplasma penetrans]RXY96928.1 ABC transporter permease [Malacoplasma penetrans]BAC44386.1 conserved hypothetical protein [Malacoplasma penetrans HF-2]
MKKLLNSKIKQINIESIKHSLSNVFNKECFTFLFVLYIKKISYYIAIALYQLLLLVFICLSLIIDVQPTYFFSNPITITFLIFLLTVVASYITIDIYKTPIEDGSELIIVSKPLNRSSIFISKLFIISIFGLINSLISIPIVSIVFSFPNSVHSYSLIALLGIPTASLVIYLAFSSISLFASIFFKKAIALVIVSVFNVIMLFFSIINIFVVDIQLKNDNTFATSYKIQYPLVLDNQNKIDEIKVVKSSNNIDFKNTYLTYFDKRTYPKLTPINFYQQLSNMYGLNREFAYLTDESYMGYSTLNYPFYYEFDLSKNALTIDKLNLHLNLNVNTTNNNFSIPFYFGLNSYSSSYLYLGEYIEKSSTEENTQNNNANNNQTNNNGTTNQDSQDESKFEYKSQIFDVQNFYNTTFKNYINQENRYFTEKRWNTDIEESMLNYIKKKNTHLYTDTSESVSKSIYGNTTNKDFLNYYGFFLTLTKISKSALSYMFGQYYDKSNMSQRLVLDEINRLFFKFFYSSDFNINTQDIDRIINEWTLLLTEDKTTSTPTDNKESEKEKFFNDNKDILINLIKLNLIGFDLARIFYGFNDLKENNEIDTLPNGSTVWSYLNPQNNKADLNSIYNKIMNNYLNPYSSLYKSIFYEYLSDSSMKYEVTYFRNFYSPTPLQYDESSNSYFFTSRSYFDTASLFVGWVLFPTILFYISFLFFRKKDIF